MKKMMMMIFTVSTMFGIRNGYTEDVVRPEWITEPAKLCTAGELCFVGEGRGVMSAQQNARAEIAQFFQVQVKVQQNIKEQKESSGIYGLDSYKESSSLGKNIESTSDEVFSAVVLKKRHDDKDLTYVLMALQKTKFQNVLEERTKKIDERITALWEKVRRFDMAEIKELLIERDTYMRQLAVLGLSLKTSPLSWGEWTKKERFFSEHLIFYYLEPKIELQEGDQFAFRPKDVESWMSHTIQTELAPSGIKNVAEEIKGSYVMKATIYLAPGHMNVKGFVKLMWEIHIGLQKKGSGESSSFQQAAQVVKWESTGRSWDQAYTEGKKQIRIKEALLKLNWE
jgi:hypothetical protein